MSDMWGDRAMRSDRAKPASATLSASLAKMLFGAAIGTMPGAALAGDESAVSPPVVALPVAASAEQRTYGPARPGMGTPANTMDRGQISIEVGIADWQHDDSAGIRSDTLLLGSTMLRAGLSRSVEALVAWTPFGHVRTRDTVTDVVDEANRVGDVTLGFKANLAHPDGSGLSAAIQPFVVLPVGGPPVGVGDWGAGIVIPVSCDLSKTVNLQLTSEADAATNSTGRGRHFAYSLIGGVSVALTPAVKATGELAVRQDKDPVQPITQVFGSMAIGWNVRDDLQLDVGGAAGLNADTPATRFYAGFSRRLL